ncbi:unnamed protein product [Urochloa decumbens]|uniref:Solute carrier family 35 member F1-like n=1 Tax=Urochloa decumbens TaxID=240449 RepID=A0ABC8VQ07_9POAL
MCFCGCSGWRLLCQLCSEPQTMGIKRKTVWGMLLVLLLGQIVSFSVAISSFASSLIANLGVDAPLTQLFFAYLLLTIVYVPIVLRRREKLQISWYWYLALAFTDVQGNYLVVKAYQYSYITSVTFLNCFTLVWVIVLTRYTLGTRYSLWQFVGTGVCVAGLALALLSDANSPDEDLGKIPLLGDALVIAGTVCYALNNVGQEYCVKKKDRVEVVAMIGLFGLLVSVVQIFLFERKSLEAVTWPSMMISLFAGYAAGNFTFCSVTPFVLKMSGSTLFNLSLLTSGMWAAAIQILFYHQQINWMYYMAFIVVAIGLIIYSLNESSSDDKGVNAEVAAQYQQLGYEDNSTERGSNSGCQERTHNDGVHIC